jgi:hypothetical protein
MIDYLKTIVLFKEYQRKLDQREQALKHENAQLKESLHKMNNLRQQNVSDSDIMKLANELENQVDSILSKRPIGGRGRRQHNKRTLRRK